MNDAVMFARECASSFATEPTEVPMMIVRGKIVWISSCTMHSAGMELDLRSRGQDEAGMENAAGEPLVLGHISWWMSRIWSHVMNSFPMTSLVVVDQLEAYMEYCDLPYCSASTLASLATKLTNHGDDPGPSSFNFYCWPISHPIIGSSSS